MSAVTTFYFEMIGSLKGKTGRAACPAMPEGYFEFRDGYATVCLGGKEASKMEEFIEEGACPYGCEYREIEGIPTAGPRRIMGKLTTKAKKPPGADTKKELDVLENTDGWVNLDGALALIKRPLLNEAVQAGKVRKAQTADKKVFYLLSDIERMVK